MVFGQPRTTIGANMKNLFRITVRNERNGNGKSTTGHVKSWEKHLLFDQVFGARLSDGSELEESSAHHQVLYVAVVDQYATAVGEVDESLQGTENQANAETRQYP